MVFFFITLLCKLSLTIRKKLPVQCLHCLFWLNVGKCFRWLNVDKCYTQLKKYSDREYGTVGYVISKSRQFSIRFAIFVICSFTIITWGNGIGDQSESLGRDYLRFIFTLMPLRKIEIHIFSCHICVNSRADGFFSLVAAIGLGKRKTFPPNRPWV